MITGKKKFLIPIITTTILVICLALPYAYAVYQGKIDIGVSATTGGLICDVVVDTNPNYIENNEVYFLVTVNNWKTESGKTVVTDTDVKYNLTIENKDNTVGLYRYVDDEGNTNGKGESKVSITNQYLGKTKISKKYKVYVTSTTNLKANVNFKVRLDSEQRNMG